MRKMTKIDIITRPGKLEELKDALADIGVTGMTVSQVFGCGLQKGHTEVYRGKEYTINLLAGIKIEIVVCEVPVATVVDTVKKICRTGKIGDGKIFIYPVENAVRIRTGEEGDIAIMDPQDLKS
ncbi:MAG: nitrogen regulatory protein [Firmicutes bacterium]|nr:nitrogen regulatory protein [Bacillota bacterium]